MEDSSHKFIWTKFYKSKLETDSDIQSRNYNRYTLFSLKIWIYLWVKGILGNDIFIKENEMEKEDNIFIVISFNINENNPIEIPNEQYNLISEKINNFDINKYNWFPIYSHKYDTNLDDGTVIPRLWVKQMLNYINLNPNYQPYNHPDGLLINLSSNPDYMNLAGDLAGAIRDKLIEMYKIGFIFKPSQSLVNNWKLIPHDIKGANTEYTTIDQDQEEELANLSIKTVNYLINYDEMRTIPDDNLLYKANWHDDKIIGRHNYITDFLISRMKGDTNLEIDINLNLLDKHEVANALQKSGFTYDDFMFTPDGVSFPEGGKDYETAKRIVTLISNYIINKKSGRDVEIGFLKASRIEEFNNVKEGIIYRELDQERPYTASFLNL